MLSLASYHVQCAISGKDMEHLRGRGGRRRRGGEEEERGVEGRGGERSIRKRRNERVIQGESCRGKEPVN